MVEELEPESRRVLDLFLVLSTLGKYWYYFMNVNQMESPITTEKTQSVGEGSTFRNAMTDVPHKRGAHQHHGCLIKTEAR